MRRPFVAVLVSLALLGGACGVEPQRQPETVRLEPSEPASTHRPSNPSPVTVVVYFIRGKRLQAVNRGAPDSSARSMLQVLAAGPTRSEVLDGLRTAIPPLRFNASTSETSSSVAVVQVDEGFASITGENQLLAVAQVVWTITERPGVERARLELKGRPLEVPTDRGLVGYPVSRNDFSSVRPVGGEMRVSD